MLEDECAGTVAVAVAGTVLYILSSNPEVRWHGAVGALRRCAACQRSDVRVQLDGIVALHACQSSHAKHLRLVPHTDPYRDSSSCSSRWIPKSGCPGPQDAHQDIKTNQALKNCEYLHAQELED